MSSRVRRARGARHPWEGPGGQIVDFPLIVDHVVIHPVTLQRASTVEARVDLVDGVPALVSVTVTGEGGLNLDLLQEHFRWATPLDIVTQVIPRLLTLGINPYRYDYATTGYPAAAQLERAVNTRLTDQFLEEIALRYLAIGRGYSHVIAGERAVSPRTVVSWIERARSRGILTSPGAGGFGGRLVPPSQRSQAR